MPARNSATQLTVVLPNNVLDIVRAKVSSGEYANESAFVEAAIVDMLLPSFSEKELSDEWLRKEVVPVLEALDADPSRGRTPEQVLDRLRQRHARLRKVG